MRARTTWNNTEILQRTSATTPTAATNRTADPYAMNQDHIKQQPAADGYITGDPSAFAEDITTPNEWGVEYSGGAVKRDEIGLPEVRPDTFNHPEKTAAVNHEAILKKADLTVKIARRMLGANASEVALEEQAAALMLLPDVEVINTYNRLAGEMPPQFKDNAEKKKEEAQAAKKQEAEQTQEQAKQAALKGDTAAFNAAIAKLVKLANDPMQQEPPAQQQAGQQQSQMQDQSAWYDSKGQRPGHSGPDTGPYAGQQQAPMQQQAQPQQQAPMQQQAQPQQQAPMEQQAQQPQDVEAQVQQMIQEAAQAQKQANGQPMQQQGPQQQQGSGYQQQQAQGQPQQQAPMQQQAQQPQQQAPMQQQAQPQQQAPVQQQAQGQPQQQGQPVQASDDQLLDQMLMPSGGQAAGPAPSIAEMDIEMNAPTMDIGDVSFAPGEDDVLKQLFASGDEAQAAQQAQDAQQGQQAQASVRTASTRTVGTRPTVGVARIGGAGAPPSRGQEVDKLTSLWASAPDVREVFGLKT